MSREALGELKQRMLPYMERNFQGTGVDMLLFMLTNIVEESTDLLFLGTGAMELVESAFGGKTEENSAFLPGVVSRKKQMVPSIIRALQKRDEA